MVLLLVFCHDGSLVSKSELCVTCLSSSKLQFAFNVRSFSNCRFKRSNIIGTLNNVINDLVESYPNHENTIKIDIPQNSHRTPACMDALIMMMIMIRCKDSWYASWVFDIHNGILVYGSGYLDIFKYVSIAC